MKITCNSCGSKYTIADAKVQGKKVKVRCKGCKESILVDGTKIGSEDSAGSTDESETESDADEIVSAPGASESMTTDEGPKKDLWSVNLSDDDSRDMTLEELIAGWKAGTVTSDAYVWKDGMGDWKPILEVGELKLKLGASPKKAGVVSSASPAAAAAAGGGMDDLFGGVGSVGNEPGVVEKSAPKGDAGKPTGARNDSSVLFSLDSLNSASGTSAPQTGSSSADALFAGLDGGGASLTNNNADLLMAPAKEPPPAPAGNRAAPAAPPPGKGKGGLIAAILGAAVIIGGAVVFMSGGDDAEEPKEDVAASAEKTEEEKKAEKELAEKMAKLEKIEAELKKAKEEAAKKGEDPDDAAKQKEEELKKEEEEAAKKAEEAKKAEASDSSSSSSSSGSKDSGSSTSTAKAASAPKFDVGAARAALQAAAANAAGCGKPGGPTGSGKVQVTFSTSGRVTSATVVAGPFGGTAVGGCVASTFRRARVPAFSGGSQTVAKSFSVR